jgi:hypothetical protein
MFGATGCAELASSIPSLTIDANTTRWRHASEMREEDERWSWGFRVGATGSFGEPTSAPSMTRVKPIVSSRTLGTPGTRCRIRSICTWELRSRARALEYARAILREEHHP